MKIFIPTLALLSSLLLPHPSKADEIANNTAWKVRMQGMLSDVMTLFPLVFNDEKFSDPKNAPAIEKSLASLVKHSEELKKHTSRYNRDEGLKIDPSFPFIAESFQSDLYRAESSFDRRPSGSRQSQDALRSAIGKCMLCHSQTNLGPELEISPFKPPFAALSVHDRFLAFAATRQFDKALGTLEEANNELKAKKPKYAELDRVTRGALAILVRVKKDPKRALQFVNKISAADVGPSIYKNDLKAWKKSLTEWQNAKAADLTNDPQLFAEAKKLFNETEPTRTHRANAPNADISLLRASGLLHDLLSNYPKSPHRAESYLMLADIYQALPGFAVWDLGDEYLGACIHENPHSAMGEKCYARYEESLTLGYSGSSGTHIPKAVKEHLARLKDLAAQTPEAKTKTK